MKLQRKSTRRALAVGAAAVSGALLLTACGSDTNGGTASAGSSSTAGGITCGGRGDLLASGSTAQQNAMSTWITDYLRACPGTTVNYKGTGSGAGITEFLTGTTAFAGSDSPLTPEEITASKKTCPGGRAVDLPMVGGPIALVYHLPGVPSLTLDADTTAKIFNARITRWNDPAIARLNPGVTLPATAIQTFHRAEDSGTTDNFTRYLIATAGKDWPYSGGKTWQAAGGQSATGSAGVAAGVQQTAGSIAYVELSYATANRLATAELDTGAPAPVEVSSAAASKAIADARITGTGGDLALKLNYATTAAGAWPITLVTDEIVCDRGTKAAVLPATKAFLSYIAGDAGQKELSGQGYAPLPAAIRAKVRAAIAALS